jgi:hypothetical protein
MTTEHLPATVSGLRDRTCSRCGDPVIPGRHRAFVHRPSSHAYDHEAVPRTSREAEVGSLPPTFSSASRAARTPLVSRKDRSVRAAH